MQPTTSDGDDWVSLAASPLPVTEALSWAGMPDCGAVVLFSGVVRDHAPGRDDVSSLDYEAYEEEAEPRMKAVVATARGRWASLGRVALLHRVGHLEVGEVAVVVVVSAPHRADAFEAARFCIDELKAAVPIWKRETWSGGQDWSSEALSLSHYDAAVPVTAGGCGSSPTPAPPLGLR